MGKVSTLVHFQFNWVVSYIFFRPSVEKFEHGLNSIFTYSIKTWELDASFHEPDVSLFSLFRDPVHGEYLSDNSEPQLPPSMKSCKIWCQASTCFSHIIYVQNVRL